MKKKVFTVRFKRSGETLKMVSYSSLMARKRVASICNIDISELIVDKVELIETIPYR